jgi:uncharacterized protein YjbJ (UPF0337 family)
VGRRARGKRQEARGKRQEARGKRQEARGKRQEARGKRQEARGNREDILVTTFNTALNIYARVDGLEKFSLNQSMCTCKLKLTYSFKGVVGVASLWGGRFLHFIALGNNRKHVNEFTRRD